MNILSHILPILALALLCAGWVGVQLLARRLGTKNHIEHGQSCCGSCAGSCQLQTENQRLEVGEVEKVPID